MAAEAEKGDSSGDLLSYLRRYAWLTVPLMLAAIAISALTLQPGVWNPPNLIPALNIIFLASVSFFVSILAAVSYLRGRSTVALHLGGGSLALGLGASMVLVPSVANMPNSMVTMYNTAALMAGVLNFSAVLILTLPRRKKMERTWLPLAITYLSVLVLFGLLLVLVQNGSWPVYFIAGSGQTAIGKLVLIATVSLFLISAVLLGLQRRNAGNDFTYWYALGLALIAIGLLGVSLQASIGDALNWTGRISQYLGMMFIVLAVYTSVKASGSWLLPLERALKESEDRYSALVDLSPDAITVVSEGVVLFANKAALRLLRASSGTEVIGTRAEEFSEVDHAGKVPDHIVRLLRGENIPPWETKVRALDQNLVDVEICASLIEFDSRHSILFIIRDISQRKQAEEALRVSEERFRLALLNAPVTVAIQDRDLRFVWAYNQRTADPKDVIGKTDGDLFTPEEAARLIEFKKRAMEEDHEVRGQMWFDRHGKKMFLDATFSPYHDKDGKVVGVATTSTDITQMKLAEMEIQANEARHVSLLENLQESICMYAVERGLDGRVRDCTLIEANQAALSDLGGRSIAELRGKNLAYLRLLGEGTPSIEQVSSVLATEKPASEEVRVGDAHVLSTIIPVEGSFVIAVRMDITERKVAEEALRDHERVLQMVLDNSQDGINMLDLATGKYVFLSPSQMTLTGFTPEELMDITAEEAYERVHPDDRRRSVEQQAAVAAGVDIPEPIEYRWMVKSGEYRWFSDRRKLVRDEHGRPVALVGISRDITEEKIAQRVLRDYSVRLEQSNAELQQFAYISSHDLQEPLRMVIANLSQLERKHGDSLDKDAREYIDRAIEGGGRMRELIDDLLAYSRVETQAKEVGPVDMGEVTREVAGLMEAAIKESGADLDVGPLPIVRANESQMRQVMQNLLSNAVKFRGEEPPRIRVWAEPGWQDWTFAVKDNGIGFDMEYADKVFDMFQRLHTRDKYPGNGVGLAIVKKIVERHGGRIWVESAENSGSTFYFTLPREV